MSTSGVWLSSFFIMPPLRTKKYKDRLVLANLIEDRGNTMPKCSYCESQNRKCIVSSESSPKCSECVRRGGKCDVEGPSQQDMQSVLDELRRLAGEREATLSKLLRLDRQQKFFQDRASEMIRRGLRTMDELDEAEERERVERERQEAAEKEARQIATTAVGFGGPAESDPLAGFLLDDPDFDWSALGDVGDTVATAPGS